MAGISGTYREDHIATIAAMITLVDAYLTALNARMIVLGGAATKITGSISLTVTAENAANEQFNHKITTTVNSPTLADTATLTAALSVFATAVETESDYTTVLEVSASLSIQMTN